MSRHKKEQPERVKMAVVRAWISREEVFRYYMVYSNGQSAPANKKQAVQYERAYDTKVKTIVDEPTDHTYASVAN